jgi:sugar phosphate isomerase/epimerase
MTAPDPAKLALNAATVRKRWGLEKIIEGCARHGIKGIAPWYDQVTEIGLAQAASRIRSHGLTVTGYSRGGLFTSANWRDENRRALDAAATLEAECLVVVVGGLPAGSKDIGAARKQISDALAELLPEARARRVPLAIEPLHPMQAAERSCVCSLEEALDLCDLLGPGTGVAVDTYNVWWDPKLKEQIARAAGRILAYHISDWLVPTRNVATDRGMMGDGVIDLPRLRSWVEASGYSGFHEVEIFSELDWWRRDPDEVLTACRTRHIECS